MLKIKKTNRGLRDFHRQKFDESLK